MADSKRYQVISACAIVPVLTADGEQLHTLFNPAVFEADPDHYRIVHNVASGYIAEIGAKSQPGVDGAGVAVVDGKRTDGADFGTPVTLNDPGRVNEVEQARSVAAAKLPEDGSAPDGRAGKDVWVEYLVRRGYDRGEVEKQEKPELQKLARQQS
jgi:hypothetical protein